MKSWTAGWCCCVFFSLVALACAQQDSTPGHSIGKVSIKGDLIVLELDDAALGQAHLFDLTGRTLHFIPDGTRYRVQSGPLHWNSDYGSEFTRVEATLHWFAFPFSGKLWKSFFVGRSGSIRFGTTEEDISVDPYGHRDGGIILDRFDQLAEVVAKLIEKAPAICVFLKPRMSGRRYVKELPDYVVITWEISEPFGGLLDFTWSETFNRFQLVLNRDGSIEMSYKEVAAKDAIVGIYPLAAAGDKPVAVHFSVLSRQASPFSAHTSPSITLRCPDHRISRAPSFRPLVTDLISWSITPTSV